MAKGNQAQAQLEHRGTQPEEEPQTRPLGKPNSYLSHLLNASQSWRPSLNILDPGRRPASAGSMRQDFDAASRNDALTITSRTSSLLFLRKAES